MKAIKRVLSKHKGEIPVYVYMEAIKRRLWPIEDYWVNIEEKELFEELVEILGEENVKVS